MPLTNVLDSTMYYEETGTGTPLVFLHGNPGSSHLWRNVLPAVDLPARILAPDLIGMGRSGKPDLRYRFDDHARYLDAFFDRLDLADVILVGHDWGGSLAFDWAARHPDRVRGVAFLEAIVRPLSWSELGDAPRARAEAMRGTQGEALVLDSTYFLESAFTGGVLSPVREPDLRAYLSPYPTRESRRPILEWARSLPLDGEPADVAERVEQYGKWLAASDDTPKLLLTFDSSPTLLIGTEMAAWCQENIAALTTAHCGPAGHHAPEDQPDAIARAVTTWARRHDLTHDRDTTRRSTMTASDAIPFGTQLIGRTEKALNAILDRQLAGTGITEPQWVTLTLTVVSGGLPTAALVERIRDALKVDQATAREHVAALTAAGLLVTTPAGAVEASERGTAQWNEVRAATGLVSQRLWGDLPEDDLAAAGRVLNTVLSRADGVLAAAG
ncbi:haloalkane dehalogenase [Micromonospora musae]|uniref:Haloalkane dehalogenase n=1 Tax=Micromonospora musae TaxID=1894970 RepID=A0A3A9XJZ7_9ACTN|nr:haloalkane dehalogenase [Micromonospora musae]RKN25549.1 haloalkane dehalogenase [Micromonospora musae]